ncbi:MAG: hypothetical protein NC911_03905 [Candidatus Omnitrophica bacterium]|nr:hypothetical protein [Candidatus Omnitrophota bacterium]
MMNKSGRERFMEIKTFCCAFLLLTGCLSSGEKKIVSSASVLIPLTGRASKAIRSLPASYIPGQPVRVKISVFPNPSTAGVIVEETLPENWKISQSIPPYQKNEGNSYKWVFWSREMKPFEIVYQALAPEQDSGVAVFDGQIKTHEEKSVPIQGDKTIKPSK